MLESPELSPKAKEASIQRLRELATTPLETAEPILYELDGYLNSERKQRPKDTCSRVQALLDEAEASEGYELWKSVILQYKAKHLLACNDFDGAGDLFRQALDAGFERNFGPLRGEIARDCFAVAVANQKLIQNNHEKYYREMLQGGVFEGDISTSIENTARGLVPYFWDTLYKPYPGIERITPLAHKKFKEFAKCVAEVDVEKLRLWVKKNRKELNSHLPMATGESLLMLWIKGFTPIQKELSAIQQRTPAELLGGTCQPVLHHPLSN